MLVGDTATSLLVGAVNYKPILASTAVRLAWKKVKTRVTFAARCRRF